MGVECFSSEGQELGRDSKFVALFEGGEEEGDLGSSFLSRRCEGGRGGGQGEVEGEVPKKTFKVAAYYNVHCRAECFYNARRVSGVE